MRGFLPKGFHCTFYQHLLETKKKPPPMTILYESGYPIVSIHETVSHSRLFVILHFRFYIYKQWPNIHLQFGHPSTRADTSTVMTYPTRRTNYKLCGVRCDSTARSTNSSSRAEKHTSTVTAYPTRRTNIFSNTPSHTSTVMTYPTRRTNILFNPPSPTKLPPSPTNIYAPIRPKGTIPPPKYLFICCQCNRMRRNRDAGCPACAHSLPYCLRCTPKVLLTSWTSPTGGKVWKDALVYARKEKGWEPNGGEIGEGGLVWHGPEQGFKEADAEHLREGQMKQWLIPLALLVGILCIAYFTVSFWCYFCTKRVCEMSWFKSA